MQMSDKKIALHYRFEAIKVIHKVCRLHGHAGSQCIISVNVYICVCMHNYNVLGCALRQTIHIFKT